MPYKVQISEKNKIREAEVLIDTHYRKISFSKQAILKQSAPAEVYFFKIENTITGNIAQDAWIFFMCPAKEVGYQIRFVHQGCYEHRMQIHRYVDKLDPDEIVFLAFPYLPLYEKDREYIKTIEVFRKRIREILGHLRGINPQNIVVLPVNQGPVGRGKLHT